MADERTTNTAGGAYIEGEVNTGGGDFVGRDKVTQIDQRGQQISGDQYNAGNDINVNQAPDPSPGPPNTPLWRWIVAAGIIVALVAGLVAIVSDSMNIQSLLATVTPTPSPTTTPLAFAPVANDEALIVLATFHETGANKTEPHIKIQRAIKEAAEKIGLKTLRVEVAPTELTADQRAEAEVLGKSYNASIVIWGEDTGVQVLVNFLNVKQPDFRAAEVKISETERTQLANPNTYAHFILSDLPGELTFLSFLQWGNPLFRLKIIPRLKR